MDINQDQLREQVKLRCLSQKVIADELNITNIFLNTWIRGKRNFSNKTLKKVEVWLAQ